MYREPKYSIKKASSEAIANAKAENIKMGFNM